MLVINDLHVRADGRDILKGLSLSIGRGEVHAIMGPNGSGKSTLAQVLAGRDGYEITSGTVEFLGQNLFELATGGASPSGALSGISVPDRNSRREQHLSAQGSAQCTAQGPG